MLQPRPALSYHNAFRGRPFSRAFTPRIVRYERYLLDPFLTLWWDSLQHFKHPHPFLGRNPSKTRVLSTLVQFQSNAHQRIYQRCRQGLRKIEQGLL